MVLAPKLGRGVAHDKVSEICTKVAHNEGRLIDLLDADPDIHQYLDRPTLEKLLDPTSYLGSSATMVDRMTTLVSGASRETPSEGP